MAVDGLYGGPYVAYVEYGPSPGAAKKINFSKFDSVNIRMTDPITLSPPVSQGSLWRFQGPNVAIGSQGYVYVAWAVLDSGFYDNINNVIRHERGIGFARLTNSGTTLDSRLDTIPGLGVRGILGPLKWSRINVNSFPSMAVDRSGFPGNIYIVWADRRSLDGSPDIYLTRSRDRGTTWDSPVRVNDSRAATDQWMPWVTVDPNGYVHVVY